MVEIDGFPEWIKSIWIPWDFSQENQDFPRKFSRKPLKKNKILSGTSNLVASFQRPTCKSRDDAATMSRCYNVAPHGSENTFAAQKSLTWETNTNGWYSQFWLMVYLPLWKMMEFVSWDKMKFTTEWEVIKLYKIVPKHQPGMLGILNFMLLNDIEFIRMFDDSPSGLHRTRWASMWSASSFSCESVAVATTKKVWEKDTKRSHLPISIIIQWYPISIFTNNPISRLVFRIWIPGGSGPDPASQDQPGTRDPPSTYKITMGWVLRSI